MTDKNTPPVPDRLRRIRTRDLDTALVGLRGLYGEVQADVRGDFEWRADVTDLGPVAVVHGACTAAFALDAETNVHVLSLPVSNAMEARGPGGSAEIAVGRGAALFSPGARIGLRSASDMKVLTVRIDPSFLVAQLEALTGATVRQPIRFDLALPLTGPGSGAYVEQLCRFIAGQITSGALAAWPAAVPGLLESLACALVTGHSHDHAHLLDRPAAPSGRAVVRMVEEYVDAHAAEPIAVADLAALTGTGVLSLDAAFRLYRGTTPAAFIRARRLERARRAVLEDAQPHRESPTGARRRGLVASSPRGAGEPPTELAGRLVSLSPREWDVAVRVARGMLNKQIAADLGIAERTVKEHRAVAMKKLGVGSAAELGGLLARVE